MSLRLPFTIRIEHDGRLVRDGTLTEREYEHPRDRPGEPTASDARLLQGTTDSATKT